MMLEREQKTDERADKREQKTDERVDRLREEMRQKMEQQRAEAEVRLEMQREETEKQRLETEAVRTAAVAKACVSDVQLEALQARLDALHQAKLLTDDEIFKLEDCVWDFIECRSSLTAAPAEIGAVAGQVKRLVGLSEGVSKDGMLARQLRRKFA